MQWCPVILIRGGAHTRQKIPSQASAMGTIVPPHSDTDGCIATSICTEREQAKTQSGRAEMYWLELRQFALQKPRLNRSVLHLTRNVRREHFAHQRHSIRLRKHEAQSTEKPVHVVRRAKPVPVLVPAPAAGPQ